MTKFGYEEEIRTPGRSRRAAVRPALGARGGARPCATATVALLAALVLLGVAPSAAVPANPLDEADAARAAGDLDRALELYDRVLEERPDDARALLGSALALSWSRRFDDALRRYDRLLHLEPDNWKAAFERAKVLSWDGRFAEAALALRELLERRPGDAEVRLALARTLAWEGERAEAREIFAGILERDPGNVEAMVGIGQTWAWAGRFSAARRWYERALELRPQDRAARIGLAYVHLWAGDARTAAALAGELERDHPDDRDVRELVEAARGAAGPWVRASTDRVDDTDDNRLHVHRVSVGRGLRGPLDLRLEAARYDMSDPSGEASIDSLAATVDLRPRLGRRVTLRLGVDRAETTTGRRETETLGGASFAWGLDRAWQGTVSATRDALRYAPRITDAGIVIDELRAAARGSAGDRWGVRVDAALADFSDDNRRVRAGAAFDYRLPLARPRLETGLGWRYMDYEKDLDNGYFDPARFRSALAHLRGRAVFGERKNTFDFEVDVGWQAFTRTDSTGPVPVRVDTNGDGVVVVAGTLGFPLGRSFVLELFADWSDYAAQTAAGFESRQLGLRLRWSGGG